MLGGFFFVGLIFCILLVYINIEVFFIEFTLVFIPDEGRKEEKTVNVTYSCTPTSNLYLCSSL